MYPQTTINPSVSAGHEIQPAWATEHAAQAARETPTTDERSYLLPSGSDESGLLNWVEVGGMVLLPSARLGCRDAVEICRPTTTRRMAAVVGERVEADLTAFGTGC
jgi:hypothetical protein